MKSILPILLSCVASLAPITPAFANPIWQSYFDAGLRALSDRDEKKAASLFEASLKEARLTEGANPELANSLFAVALTKVRLTPEEAEPLFTECLKVDPQVCGEKSACEGMVHKFLGDIAYNQNKYDDAESHYRLAISDLEQVDKDKIYSARILASLSQVYEHQGKRMEAEALKQGPQADVSAWEDVTAYSKFVVNPLKAPEPKRAEAISRTQNDAYHVKIPMTETRGVDEHGYPTITFSAKWPSPQTNSASSYRSPYSNPIATPAKTAEVDYGPYKEDLQRRIKRAWFPPKGMENKRVVVVFKVDKVGTLSNEHVLSSSGFREADDAAILAVQHAAPFRKLPDGATMAPEIQFTFDYNVFTGGGGGGAAFRRF